MKILTLLFFILLSTNVWATPPTRVYNYVPNAVIDPNQNNTNENSLYSYLQTGVDTYAPGSISAADINANASISYSQLSLSNSILGSDINTSAALSIASLLTTGNVNIGGTFKLGTTHQGDILYDNGTSLVRLTPGTAGQVLQTQGSSANPQWSYPSGQLGSWTSKSVGTIYQATTDGFVTATSTAIAQPITLIGLTDSSATPTTIRQKVRATDAASTGFISVCFPVKKNDYYEVTNGTDTPGTTSEYFIPLGS